MLKNPNYDYYYTFVICEEQSVRYSSLVRHLADNTITGNLVFQFWVGVNQKHTGVASTVVLCADYKNHFDGTENAGDML